MNEKLEALNQEIEKTEKKLRWAQQEEKRLTHQAKALTRKERTHRLCTTGRNGRTGFAPEPPCWKATFPTRKPSRMNRSVCS